MREVLLCKRRGRGEFSQLSPAGAQVEGQATNQFCGWAMVRETRREESDRESTGEGRGGEKRGIEEKRRGEEEEKRQGGSEEEEERRRGRTLVICQAGCWAVLRPVRRELSEMFKQLVKLSSQLPQASKMFDLGLLTLGASVAIIPALILQPAIDSVMSNFDAPAR